MKRGDEEGRRDSLSWDDLRTGGGSPSCGGALLREQAEDREMDLHEDLRRNLLGHGRRRGGDSSGLEGRDGALEAREAQHEDENERRECNELNAESEQDGKSPPLTRT